MPNSQRFHPDLRVIAHLLPGGALQPPHAASHSRTHQIASTALTEGCRCGGPPERNQRTATRTSAPRQAGGALLWIHGGGYVIGSAAQDAGLCRRFADRLGVPVVAV